jgi:hypothetical protein
MRNSIFQLLLALLLMAGQPLSAQERRPIDNEHPLWFIHIDVWNSADPQKIINLIPEDIKPYVCMNLSLSCQFDTDAGMYRMPRCAERTYKSWASVCQQNGLWFSCQPASGGHTHIQDDDIETFEYFFKTYPNFLGWNYAEQFWGFDESGDMSSSTQASRLALFAKLVPMHHKYGGFLTVSFCGNVWSHPLNPMGMMKRNKDLLKACKDYPEAILWLYKYTTSSCWYNNESVTFGPFISGLAKNYGVRYDNCGWNGALSSILGENHGKKYPGAAGIGTVMEQTCVNGGAVWDGPELIWTEDFQNLNNSTVDGYTRRNWGMYPNFKGVWIDMFRQIIDGTMYIPTREEVVKKTKIVIQNDVNSGSDEQKYAAWGDLYNGLYKQDDPFNRGNGQWMENFCYFKKTGRYGTIPLIIGYYDNLVKSIPVQVKKSTYSSRWGTQAKKVADFNEQYPEVSTGDLFVNRYRNQLVTYTPYSNLNSKKRAQAEIPLQYNTCEKLCLDYGKLSSGLIREYADHIDFYLNNYRSDSTSTQTDTITVVGVTAQPSYKLTKHSTGASGYSASATAAYDAEAKTFSVRVKHMGPIDLTIQCQGDADRSAASSDAIEQKALPMPKQPEPIVAPVIIEAENMDYKNVRSVALTHSGWFAPDVSEFAGMGYVDLGTNTTASLRHQLTLQKEGEYDIFIRYCNSTKTGKMTVNVNGTAGTIDVENVARNNWRKAKLTTALQAGVNNLVITNTSGIGMLIDQIIYSPVNTPVEKFKVTIRDVEHGKVIADVDSAAEGQVVKLTILPEEGFSIKDLSVVNSVYYTMGKKIPVKATDAEVTFTMNDANITIRPKFADASSLYKLDFTDVLSGAMPQGWRTVQGGSEVHEYPNTYGSGARTFTGFTGYQGKALYWRESLAEYGRQTSYPLTLQPGNYKLTFAMAAWKGTPKYKARILNSNNSTIAAMSSLTAAPNADGNNSANLTSANLNELPFEVKEKGNYVISFVDEGTGFDEFLLLECRVVATTSSDIAATANAHSLPVGIYDLSGLRRSSLQRGMNIVVTADGKTRKIIVK